MRFSINFEDINHLNYGATATASNGTKKAEWFFEKGTTESKGIKN